MVSPHSDGSHLHAIAPHCLCAASQARPTMSCIQMHGMPVRLT